MRQAFAWWSTRARADTASSLAAGARSIGYEAAEIVLPRSDEAAVQAAGLSVLSVLGQLDLARGPNDRDDHAQLEAELRDAMRDAQRLGATFVLLSPGTRRAEHDGRAATTEFLARMGPVASGLGLTLAIEPLNSRYDHPGAECDHLAWAEQVVRDVADSAVRLVFDCYHVQLSGGDLLNSIRRVVDVTGYVQTAGAPGRNELDHRQEINYAAVARTLDDIGYAGWVSHELVPTGDALAALQQAYDLFAEVR